MKIDEAMLPLSNFVEEMINLDTYIMEENGVFSMNVSDITLGMPVQMDIQVSKSGKVKLGSSPPLYYSETTFMPVFHHLRLNIEVDNSN